MKKLIAASALVLVMAAPAFAQQGTSGTSANPNVVDQPANRGLGSDDIVGQENGTPGAQTDSGTTQSILPPGSVDDSVVAPGAPTVSNPGTNASPGASGSVGSGTINPNNPGVGSTGSGTVNSPNVTSPSASGGNSSY